MRKSTKGLCDGEKESLKKRVIVDEQWRVDGKGT